MGLNGVMMVVQGGFFYEALREDPINLDLKETREKAMWITEGKYSS